MRFQNWKSAKKPKNLSLLEQTEGCSHKEGEDQGFNRGVSRIFSKRSKLSKLNKEREKSLVALKFQRGQCPFVLPLATPLDVALSSGIWRLPRNFFLYKLTFWASSKTSFSPPSKRIWLRPLSKPSIFHYKSLGFPVKQTWNISIPGVGLITNSKNPGPSMFNPQKLSRTNFQLNFVP